MRQGPATHRAHGLPGGDQARLRFAELPQLAGPCVAAAARKVAQHAACERSGVRGWVACSGLRRHKCTGSTVMSKKPECMPAQYWQALLRFSSTC